LLKVNFAGTVNRPLKDNLKLVIRAYLLLVI